MVDKDGKKVNILKDLIRLEAELKSYLKEVDYLINETKPFDAVCIKCLDEFSAEIPKSVKDLRKLRQQEKKRSSKIINTTLKRPAMLGTLKPEKKKVALVESNIYSMISTNCKFRARIKDLLKQAK